MNESRTGTKLCTHNELQDWTKLHLRIELNQAIKLDYLNELIK